jgi:4-hydroxy-2-oxoheptanedioate aldolase
VKKPSLRQRLGREPLLGVLSGIDSPELVETLGYMGVDFFIADGEPSIVSHTGLSNLVRAGNLAEIPVLFRTPIPEDLRMLQPYLGTGISGLLVPDVESPARLAEIVKAVRFPPIGTRSAGACQATDYGLTGPMAAFEQDENERFVVIAQIESQAGVDAIADIIAVPGVDAVNVGTRDLANNLGKRGDVNCPEVKECVAKVRAAMKGSTVSFCQVLRNDQEIESGLAEGSMMFLLMTVPLLKYGLGPFMKHLR